MTATVRVHREKAIYGNRLRSFKIMIDGVERARVKNGSSVEIDVEPGQFSIQARIDWCGSPTLTSTVSEEQVVSFVVANGQALAMFGNTTKYLTLKQDDE